MSLSMDAPKRRRTDDSDDEEDVPHLVLLPGMEMERLQENFGFLCRDRRPEWRAQRQKAILRLYELSYWQRYHPNRTEEASTAYLKNPANRARDHAVELYHQSDVNRLCDSVSTFLSGTVQDLPEFVLNMIAEQLNLYDIVALRRASPLLQDKLPTAVQSTLRFYRRILAELGVSQESAAEALEGPHAAMVRSLLFWVSCLLCTDPRDWKGGRWKDRAISEDNTPLPAWPPPQPFPRLAWENVNLAAIKAEVIEPEIDLNTGELVDLPAEVYVEPNTITNLLLLDWSTASRGRLQFELPNPPGREYRPIYRYSELATYIVPWNIDVSQEELMRAVVSDVQSLWTLCNIPKLPLRLHRDILDNWTLLQRKQYTKNGWEVRPPVRNSLRTSELCNMSTLGPMATAYIGHHWGPFSLQKETIRGGSDFTMIHGSWLPMFYLLAEMMPAVSPPILPAVVAALLVNPSQRVNFSSDPAQTTGTLIVGAHVRYGLQSYAWSDVSSSPTAAFIVMAVCEVMLRLPVRSIIDVEVGMTFNDVSQFF